MEQLDVVVAVDGKDVHDHLAAGYGLDDFVPLRAAERPSEDLTDLTVDAILAANPGITKDELLAANPDLKALLKGRATAATRVAQLVRDSGAVLFHAPDGTGFAMFENDGVTQTWPIRSRAFKLYARLLYHRAEEATPNGQSLTDACAQLESEAIFDGGELDVHLRVAGNDHEILIDLGDPDWRAIRITATGWDVVPHPVRFRRARGIAALPDPVRGGSLDELRPFLNVAGDDEWRLIVGWLLAAARPPGSAFPVLVAFGEQGSAKSTAARVLRDLIDPSTVPLRAAPREIRDLMISAAASWVVCFDNLSHLQPWLSDGLCRLSTGGGFSTRELYSDDAEVLLDAERPVIVNGIAEVAEQSDLLDRSILVEFPLISEARRQPETEFWASFHEVRPRLVGALCDAVATALAHRSTTRLEALPRMADATLWVTAAEHGLGWKPGSFLASYRSNRAHVHDVAVEATIIGPALVEIAKIGFEGSTTELLDLLTLKAGEQVTKQKEWPNSGRAVSALLTRLAPNLRALGFEVERLERQANKQPWRIRRPQ